MGRSTVGLLPSPNSRGENSVTRLELEAGGERDKVKLKYTEGSGGCYVENSVPIHNDVSGDRDEYKQYMLG